MWEPDWRFYTTFLGNRAHLALRTGLPAALIDLARRVAGARPRFSRMYDK